VLADKIKNDIELQENLKLDSISVPQLSRKLREIKNDFWETVFSHVAKVVIQKTTNLSTTPYADRIHIMDKTVPESKKVLWQKHQCGIHPDLAGTYYLLFIPVNKGEPKGK